MQLIKTKNFEIAIYSRGDINSSKMAIVMPGTLDTKDYSHMIAHVEYLATKGFFALSFDPPGTWESPGSIELFTMTNYIKVVDEVIEYYGNKPTFLMGHSRGATISIIAGTRNKNVIAFAAVMSAFGKGVYKDDEDMQWKTKGFEIEMRDLPPGGGKPEKEFKLSYSFFEDQKKYDLTKDMTSSKKPKLFVLGKYDNIADPKVVKETFKSFSEPKELYELDSGHNYRHHPNLIREVNETVGKFLEKYKLFQINFCSVGKL